MSATHPLVLIVLLGAAIGFLGGLLGKGGSAIATPFLVALGVPPIVAVAAPLPATVPGTLLAADRYRRQGLVDRDVLRWSLLAGVPATVVGALATRWIGGHDLVLVTDAVIAALGVRMLLHPSSTDEAGPHAEPDHRRVVAVAVVTGLAAGLLANSGGFLLAPLFVAVLGLGIKPAFGTSLAVASVMAVPGTLVHLALGHLDPSIVLAFGAGSIPLSGVGARVALRTDSARLERGYGAVLVVLGVAFLSTSLR
ncbi:MAG: sulfite exporter TauE/SafE family protein [Acidimicrobiales bacterium]|nr:sulfite exporter TauE/SafE family protein [Actinomycetota bacterium]